MVFSVIRRLIFIAVITCGPHFVVNMRTPLSAAHMDLTQATFQQIFRFTYLKKENGTCPDLSTYQDLLKPALDTSEKHLPSLCAVQNSKDRITGQLKISDIAEQSKTVLVNISLVYDYRPVAIYEQCKGLVASAFQKDNRKITAPFRKEFFPLLCPAIINNAGGVLVHSEYFCRLPNQVRTQVHPGGFSHPIHVCVYCHPGKEVLPRSQVCTDCRQGFYKSSRTTHLCEPCPDRFVTRINGSSSKDDCQLRACDPGYYADVYHGGWCTPCPHGTYQPAKWTEQCLDCPAGSVTYQLAADRQDLCLPACPAGHEYSNTSQSCRACPRGYYNDGLNPARPRCVLCHVNYITPAHGATSSRDCNVWNCSQAGQYLDVRHNVCRDCPPGQWQNRKWQTSCEPCKEGFTTRLAGTTDPSYCFVVEDKGGFKLTKEEIILSMVSVLVLLMIGNLTILGYCLYSRSRRHKENINPSGQTADVFKMTDLRNQSRRPSGTYEDIELYATISDVTPCPVMSSTSTFKPTENRGEGSAHNYHDLNVYLQPSPRPAGAGQSAADLVAIPAGLESEESPYDDVMNTCPVYQNFGSRSPLAETDLCDELWSSRLDVLY
ncbi:hypothetical protein ACOMHN_012960 [Nucella lapillus]